MKKLSMIVPLVLVAATASADDNAWFLSFSGDQFTVPHAGHRHCLTQSAGVHWGVMYNSCSVPITVHYSVPNTSKQHKKHAVMRVYGGGPGKAGAHCVFQMESPWMDAAWTWGGWKSTHWVLPTNAPIQRVELDLRGVWPTNFSGPQYHMSIVCGLDPHAAISTGEVWFDHAIMP